MPGAARATGETGMPLALDPNPELGSSTTYSAPVPPLPVSGAMALREAVEPGLLGGLTPAEARIARHADPAFPGTSAETASRAVRPGQARRVGTRKGLKPLRVVD
jgi:hypothetical protein